MKKIIFPLQLIPIMGVSQKKDVFIKHTDARGQQLKGEATLKGFERWIGANTISAGGKNNTELSITMTVSGASANLKRVRANGELLLNGHVTVLSPTPTKVAPALSYTFKMENIAVTFCNEAMGCNNVMNTILPFGQPVSAGPIINLTEPEHSQSQKNLAVMLMRNRNGLISEYLNDEYKVSLI